jgi:hypothetical protein
VNGVLCERAPAAQEAAGSALKADYFDNEGHIIHYDVSTPHRRVLFFCPLQGQGCNSDSPMNSLEA